MYGITERGWSAKVIDGGLEFERSVNCYGSVKWNRLYWNTDDRGVSMDGHKSAGLMGPSSVIDVISHPNAVLVEHHAATTGGRCGRIKSK